MSGPRFVEAKPGEDGMSVEELRRLLGAVVQESGRSWVLSGPPFDGEGIREPATAADLFTLVFDAEPNQVGGVLAGAIQCAIDAFELIGRAATEEENLADLLRRTAMRANLRLRVALEVDRRMRAAERGGVS